MTTTVHCLVPRVFLESGANGGQNKMIWKFVILETAEGRHLVTGPQTEFPYHAHLVAQFCDEHEIPSAWIKKPDLVEIYDPDVHVRGGGYLQIDLVRRRMRLYGRSTAYGSFNSDDVQEAAGGDPFFRGFEAVIGGAERKQASN